MRSYKNGLLPVKTWANEIEESAFKQVENLSNLPFAYHHIALMPDCHCGYGMPIGGVLATNDVIIPNAVGVDIGCGMVAVKTTATKITEEQIKQIIGKAREVIPVGFKHHQNPQESSVFDNAPLNIPIIKQEFENMKYQLGTLGGGNHFIEIQKGDDDHIWLMIHSGSRNLGKKVCDLYNKIAQDHNAEYYSTVPKEWQLAFLPASSMSATEYLTAMNFCLEFAYANRGHMMNKLVEIFNDVTGHGEESHINIHHNYAALENHFGKNVWVHRKGAIRMREGEKGIIPGSMGTPSYIVEGLGNKESFMSASHGAGRKMSRSEADKTFTEEEANKSIDGVVFGRWNKNRKGGLDLSECPLAYKNIEEVIRNESDLVKPLVKLQPLGVMKG
ncbi:tRNA-splicing ligase RtcB [Sporomusaceae bacterium BoRhaA]|uniref:RtcB family protein n=1 Tax=Pelorhabdus rhamnosifermentans TaxID=2772457 RepID=UPI001C062B52|nr:RtcB family protein [Pelorhabdus rhamnosifermentans]MBU2701147.1 tRNA-splicing ligase RtcB [Pelorhabdus rhamnosifermentans]